MERLGPKFVVFTGDNVYYDSEQPQAVSIDLARYHWQRMYSLLRHVELLRNVASYWEKDDHDTHVDDGWPGCRRWVRLRLPKGNRSFVSKCRWPVRSIGRIAGAKGCKSGLT